MGRGACVCVCWGAGSGGGGRGVRALRGGEVREEREKGKEERSLPGNQSIPVTWPAPATCEKVVPVVVCSGWWWWWCQLREHHLCPFARFHPPQIHV